MPSLAFSYYYYPQYRWAQRLAALLPRHLEDDTIVVDAPCGDGVMSYWLVNRGIGNRFELYDRSPELVAKASRIARPHGRPIAASSRDIFTLDTEGRRDDLWLLVNSLYLLPDIDRLLERMKPRFKTIAAVFPYLDRENYRYYLRQDARWENVSGMSDTETVAFFARHGYRLDHREDATFLAQFRWDVRGSRRFLNLIDPWFRSREGNYWIGVFVRSNT